MRHLIASLFLAAGLMLGCATTCETPAASGDTGAADPDDGDPCGLNCGPDGGCNSDYPYCCKGVCKAAPCGNAGQS